MIIFKLYKGESRSFKTTFEEQEKTLAKCYVDTDKIKELLEKGDMVATAWAYYCKNPIWEMPKKAE